MLAYSTVSQLGYMVYAIGAGGIFASQFHLLSHAVFKALLFLGAGAVIHAVGTRDMREMGGLGKTDAARGTVFIIGGSPWPASRSSTASGARSWCWRAAGQGGPLWAYVIMLIGAGLTALYTLRCVWMVFFGEAAQRQRHVHDAGPAMQVALVPLAVGTLTTWLLAGPFQRLLLNTLPFHFPAEAEVETSWRICGEILSAPATYLALGVVALGLLAWLCAGLWLELRANGARSAGQPNQLRVREHQPRDRRAPSRVQAKGCASPRRDS